MQLRLPRFFSRPRAQEASGSSQSSLGSGSTAQPTLNETNATSNQLSTSPPHGRPRVTVPNPQAVVVMGGDEGLVVPFANQMSLYSPSPIALAAEPHFAHPPLKPRKKYEYECSNPAQSTKLMNLPNELLIKISLHAGFFSALTLIKTHPRFNDLLMDPRSWKDYSNAGSSDDMIESEITICTKIHTFDHLVFGLWDSPPPTASTTTNLSSEPSVYFEHMTFSEQYDFLGGVNMTLTRTGRIQSEFFEHRETLPCYKRALITAVEQGILPGTAPSGEPPAGAKIDHSCEECERYDYRRVLKSIFVFDEVPYNPRWGKEGFCWRYQYKDGRRSVKVMIKPYEGAVGYGAGVKDLPSLWIKKVKVNGCELVQGEWELFQKLIQRR